MQISKVLGEIILKEEKRLYDTEALNANLYLLDTKVILVFNMLIYVMDFYGLAVLLQFPSFIFLSHPFHLLYYYTYIHFVHTNICFSHLTSSWTSYLPLSLRQSLISVFTEPIITSYQTHNNL